MKEKYQKIWELAVPYLKLGLMKDFVVHTEGVVKSMELLIEGEDGDPDILIPAAMLHDVGFSKVSKDLQTNSDLSLKREAQRQHLIFAKDIIQEILEKVGYPQTDIDHVGSIVLAHKFQEPEEKEKRMLIDADNLSDVFEKQFYSDSRAYPTPPKVLYGYRIANEYYFQTARDIADREMAARAKEINI